MNSTQRGGGNKGKVEKAKPVVNSASGLRSRICFTTLAVASRLQPGRLTLWVIYSKLSPAPEIRKERK